MNLFISADIEGTCGITNWDETNKSHPDYLYFSKQMSLEVAAVCRAAIDSGRFEKIYIRDAHDTARNIIPNLLPKNKSIQLIRGWSGTLCPMMTGVEKADLVAYTGYHSGVGTGDNPLCHTNNRLNYSITINGIALSEFLMNTYYVSALNKPVIFISGDKGICNSASDLIPNIHYAAVSEGLGGATFSLQPEYAIDLIYNEAQKAFALDDYKNTVEMPEKFHVEYEFIDTLKAVKAGCYPGAIQTGPRRTEFETTDFYSALRFIMFAG